MEIFKNPLKVIAINSTIFICGCVLFVLIGLTAVIIESGEENPIRTEHLKQHSDDHKKYDEMIELLETLNQKMDTLKLVTKVYLS